MPLRCRCERYGVNSTMEETHGHQKPNNIQDGSYNQEALGLSVPCAVEQKKEYSQKI